VFAGVVVWVVLDGRRQRRRLSELDAQGIRRRSAGKAS
jgi:heme exporter protein D